MRDDINYCIDCILIAKLIYDNNKYLQIFNQFLETPLCEDLCWEISMICVSEVTEYTGEYYNEDQEIETNYFCDPVITEFCRLCEAVEQTPGTTSGDLEAIRNMTHEIEACFFNLQSSNYDFFLRSKTNRPRSSGIVFLYGPEFYDSYGLVIALLKALSLYKEGTTKLRALLSSVKPESRAA